MKFSSTLPGFALAFALALSPCAHGDPTPESATPRTVHFTYKDRTNTHGVLDLTPSYRSRLVTEGGSLLNLDDGKEPPELASGVVRCEIFKHVERGSAGDSGGGMSSWENFGPISSEPISVSEQRTVAENHERWVIDDPHDPPGTAKVVTEGPIVDAAGKQIVRRDLVLPASSGLELVRCEKGGAAPTDAEMNASMKSVLEVAEVPATVDTSARLTAIGRMFQRWSSAYKLRGSDSSRNIAASKVERDAQAARTPEPPAAVLVDTDADAGASLPGGTGEGAVPTD